MKRIAISQRIELIPDRDEKRDVLDHRLVSWVGHCGFSPLPVPNVLSHMVENWLLDIQPDGILLSGGGDIGQFSERDETERLLLSFASRFNLPVLGICRGMQFMAHLSGATLYPVTGHVGTRHCLNGKISLERNSYHEYSISHCPKPFEIIARSEDGVIEAIRHLSLPWEGWMWHPERERVYSQDDISRLLKLFQ